MRVIRKSKIVPTLLAGGYIRYEQIDAKPSLYDASNNCLGVIRFDTFLQLDLREIEMKLPLSDANTSPFYRLKRYDAWCGYDTYKLKEQFVAVYNSCNEDFKKFLISKIWR